MREKEVMNEDDGKDGSEDGRKGKCRTTKREGQRMQGQCNDRGGMMGHRWRNTGASDFLAPAYFGAAARTCGAWAGASTRGRRGMAT